MYNNYLVKQHLLMLRGYRTALGRACSGDAGTVQKIQNRWTSEARTIIAQKAIPLSLMDSAYPPISLPFSSLIARDA
jgi:hypothetical protein